MKNMERREYEEKAKDLMAWALDGFNFIQFLISEIDVCYVSNIL